MKTIRTLFAICSIIAIAGTITAYLLNDEKSMLKMAAGAICTVAVFYFAQKNVFNQEKKPTEL